MSYSGIANKTLQFGMHDAVINGVLVRDIPTRLIFVKDSNERDEQGDIMPGQFVATYGLTAVWQRKGDGTWATIK